MINGALGLLIYLDGQLDQTLCIATDDNLIVAVYLVRNPGKLAALLKPDAPARSAH